MTGPTCAAAAADLTEVADRLAYAAQALAGQARLPERDFGGLSGEAFRRHAARSAVAAAGAAAAVRHLAHGLAALGTGLDEAAAIRTGVAAAPGPDAADRVLQLAVRVEERAQDGWRAALDRFAVDAGPPGSAAASGSAPAEGQPVLPPPAARPVMAAARPPAPARGTGSWRAPTVEPTGDDAGQDPP